ncbi:hypothetical protein EST38_g5183 [Candolleomyces aberdarensis]|uniref:VLRF1 domain-containing protein n=1 Tax=Candolleomyces aberdarensis TaxID=2316362 RepID=A0A4Q2DKQ3_9AGAR|nr:hypothetical protein EST38_g5183 [Candolleomyces aberdarensis]
MADRRRQEIEAKRAKLAELRKAREDRQKLTERRITEVSPTPARRDVDDLVTALVGTPGRSGRTSGDQTPSESIPGTPAMSHTIQLPGPSGLSLSAVPAARSVSSNSATDNVMEIAITPRSYPDLIDMEQELFELPQKERVIYNKEVQTTAVEEHSAQDYEEEIRQRILREREAEAEKLAQEKELEEENVKLDQEIEQEIRELTEEERTSIVTAPEFLEFIEQSSKIVQRALNDNYDYIRDYTIGAEAGGDESEGKRVKKVCTFFDEHLGKNRSITDIDWSPKYPELTVASYNKNGNALNEPDGIVAVWNLHLLERPEFVFHSQSDVLTVTFSPFHSNYIFGGTYSGQILLWDTRSKHLPVLKTPLSAAGHTHPVYAMSMVGTQNAHNLITSSSDGTVCSWLVDMLAQPQETLELVHNGHNKTSEVAITTLDFPSNETTTFWVGTEEGNVYQANRYDRAGAKAGLNPHDVYKGHYGPVLGLDFHSSIGPIDFGDLFLTCSVDWTVKLWRAKSLTKPSTSLHHIPPLYSFDEADDYVYDVKWHPTHPASFGTVDGSGKFDLWNLNVDTEVPIVSTTVGTGRGLNKLQWDRKEGRRAALGGSDGHLYIYDIGDMALPRETEWADLQKVVAGMVGLEDSLSGSASSDDDDDSDDAVNTLVKRTGRLAARSPSPESGRRAPLTSLIWFHSPPSTQIGIYRTLFPLKTEPNDYLKELLELQTPRREGRTWAMFMVAGGHFAGAVVRVSRGEEDEEEQSKGGKKKQKRPKPDTEVLLHKTFHRYTTRRKQGGSQSVNDNAKGPAKSAGAQLRRYGEQALRDDIRNLLNEWADDIHDCERIWIRASTANKRIFYDYDEAVVQKGDERLRGFPFPTRRPTQSEITRCLAELTRVKISHFTEDELREQDEAYLASLPKPKPAPPAPIAQVAPQKLQAPKLTPEEEALREKWTRLVEMVTRGRVEPLKAFWEREQATFGGIDMPIPEWTGERVSTLLQLAAHTGQADVVQWLLEEARADPTVPVAAANPTDGDGVDNSGNASEASELASSRLKGSNRTAYDLAKTKAVRDVFRRCAALHLDWWDWLGAGHIPSVLSQEMEEGQEQKKKVRRKGLKDKVKEREAKEKEQAKDAQPVAAPEAPALSKAETVVDSGSHRLGGSSGGAEALAGLTPEMRMRLERERRARAAEARLRALGGK